MTYIGLLTCANGHPAIAIGGKFHDDEAAKIMLEPQLFDTYRELLNDGSLTLNCPHCGSSGIKTSISPPLGNCPVRVAIAALIHVNEARHTVDEVADHLIRRHAFN